MSVKGDRITEVHRQAQTALAAGTLGDLRRTWPLLDPGDLSGSFERFARPTSLAVLSRRAASAGLGARYYGTLRAAEGVDGLYQTVSGASMPLEKLVTSLRVEGPVRWKRALARGADPAEAQRLAFAETQRAMARHVLDGGRETILGTMLADEQARGWSRVSDGRPCAFCAMLVSRGAVYKSEDTGGFKTHNGCGCSARPFWDLTPEDSRHSQELRQLWGSSTVRLSGDNAIREFRRQYEDAIRSGRLKPRSGPTVSVPSAFEKATLDKLIPPAREEKWVELSKDEVVARAVARAPKADAAKMESQLIREVDRLEYSVTRRMKYVEELSVRIAEHERVWLAAGGSADDFAGSFRWKVDTSSRDKMLKAAAKEQKQLEAARRALAAVRKGGPDPAVVAAAEKIARTHRVFANGPHEYHFSKASIKAYDLTDEKLTQALKDFDLTRASLPEWRRYTSANVERPYTIVVDGSPKRKGANGYTYLSNEVVWMNPSLVREIFDSPHDRGLWSMPAHRTVSGHRYTLTHEMGHTTDHEADRAQRNAAYLWAMRNPNHPDFEREGGGGGSMGGHLSQYGASKSEEAYAEVFAEWALGGGKDNPVVRHYAQRFGWEQSWDDYRGVWSIPSVGSRRIDSTGRERYA